MTNPAITTFRGFPATAAYVWSPFACKLEARLRFAGLAYKVDQGAPPKGPRGKIPYIALSKDSDSAPEMVSDTSMISEKLVDAGLAEDLNAKLTPVEKAQDAAVRALLEEKLYFYQVRLCYFLLSMLISRVIKSLRCFPSCSNRSGDYSRVRLLER